MSTFIYAAGIAAAIIAAAVIVRLYNTYRDGRGRGTPPDWGRND